MNFDNENDISVNKDNNNRFTNLGTGYEDEGLFGDDGPQDGDDVENEDNNNNTIENNTNDNPSTLKKLKSSFSSSNFRFKYNLKIILLGDISVGKTSLLLRFINNNFNEKQGPSINVDKKTKSISLDSDTVANLSIWDTVGQERFRNLTKNYYSDIQGAIIVYDINNKESFQQVDFWYKDLQENAPKNVLIMLIGNKTDIRNEQSVSWVEGKNYGDLKKINCFYEVSAKNGNNVELAFSEFTRKLVEKEIEDEKKNEFEKNNKDLNTIDLEKNIKKKYKKKGCC
jgi:small GTP-binding protein